MKINSLKLVELKRVWNSDIKIVCNYIESNIDSRNLKYKLAKEGFKGILVKNSLLKYMDLNEFFSLGVIYLFYIEKNNEIINIQKLINFIEIETKSGIVLILIINNRLITINYFKSLVNKFNVEKNLNLMFLYGLKNILFRNLIQLRLSNMLLLSMIKRLEGKKNANI